MVNRFRWSVCLCVCIAILVGAAAWAQKSSSQSSGSEGTVVAVYSTTGGALRPDSSVRVTADHRKLYDAVESYVYAALPPDAGGLVTRLELFVTPDTAEDPSDGTASTNEDGATWTLSVDYGEGEHAVVEHDASEQAVFDETIAHEIAHVLSLNDSQMTDDDTLGTYTDESGSYTVTAYLNQFYQRFWKSRYPDWKTQSGSDPATDRYDGNPTGFVSEYAATDPSEDFAESFAYFVLQPKPTGSSDKARKLQFFYAFPDLVKDRDFLRGHLVSSR